MPRFKIKATEFIIKEHEFDISANDAEQAEQIIKDMFTRIKIETTKEIKDDNKESE